MVYSGVLKKVRWECVHFTTSSDIDENSDLGNCLLVQTDFAEVDSKSKLLDVLSRLFKFPDYFGHNWDALDECLRDLGEWMPADGYVLQVHGAETFWRHDPLVAGTLVMVWLSAAESWSEDNVPFHLIFVMD